MSFGPTLRDHLQNAGFSQAYFAESLGISRARLNNYLMGRSEPDYELLRQMAKKLDVSVDSLLEVESRNIPKEQAKVKSFEASSELVLRSSKPEMENGPYSWIPLYKTTVNGFNFSDVPVAWMRIPEKQTNSLADKTDYALLVSEDSMSPHFLLRDIVLIRSTISYLFLQTRPDNAFFAVRTQEEDKIGLTIRRCFFQNNMLTMVAVNPSVAPIVMDIGQTPFVPITGKAVSMLRVYSDLEKALEE